MSIREDGSPCRVRDVGRESGLFGWEKGARCGVVILMAEKGLFAGFEALLILRPTLRQARQERSSHNARIS